MSILRDPFVQSDARIIRSTGEGNLTFCIAGP
jgi:hypothetical protein